MPVPPCFSPSPPTHSGERVGVRGRTGEADCRLWAVGCRYGSADAHIPILNWCATAGLSSRASRTQRPFTNRYYPQRCVHVVHAFSPRRGRQRSDRSAPHLNPLPPVSGGERRQKNTRRIEKNRVSRQAAKHAKRKETKGDKEAGKKKPCLLVFFLLLFFAFLATLREVVSSQPPGTGTI